MCPYSWSCKCAARTSGFESSAQGDNSNQDPERSGSGRLADVVVVEGDPLSDIKLLQCRDKIKLIMKDGNIYKQTLGE